MMMVFFATWRHEENKACQKHIILYSAKNTFNQITIYILFKEYLLLQITQRYLFLAFKNLKIIIKLPSVVFN